MGHHSGSARLRLGLGFWRLDRNHDGIVMGVGMVAQAWCGGAEQHGTGVVGVGVARVEQISVDTAWEAQVWAQRRDAGVNAGATRQVRAWARWCRAARRWVKAHVRAWRGTAWLRKVDNGAVEQSSAAA